MSFRHPIGEIGERVSNSLRWVRLARRARRKVADVCNFVIVLNWNPPNMVRVAKMVRFALLTKVRFGRG